MAKDSLHDPLIDIRMFDLSQVNLRGIQSKLVPLKCPFLTIPSLDDETDVEQSLKVVMKISQQLIVQFDTC